MTEPVTITLARKTALLVGKMIPRASLLRCEALKAAAEYLEELDRLGIHDENTGES